MVATYYDLYAVNALATGDFNGDGKLDLVTGSYGAVTWRSHKLTARQWRQHVPVALPIDEPGASVMSVVVGDFNGDGHLDVAALLEAFSGLR